MASPSSPLRPRPSSRCPSISTPSFPRSSCDVRWGLPRCDGAALITGSWTVCGSRYVIILQPGGRAESTQSTSAMWCGSQIYSCGPHITAVQVFKRRHIFLNTGIKLGVWVEEEEVRHCWQERENGGGRRKCWGKWWKNVQPFTLVHIFGPDLKPTHGKPPHDLICQYIVHNHNGQKKKKRSQNENQEGRSKGCKKNKKGKNILAKESTGWEKTGRKRSSDQRQTAMTVTGENQSVILNHRILWPLTPPVWQHLTHHPSLWGRLSSAHRERDRVIEAEKTSHSFCPINPNHWTKSRL